MFACARKDRLQARSGLPYLALELRDRSGAIQARAFRDADLLAGRFERGDLVRVRGRVERFRDELQLELREIARAEGADPAAFLPVAYRDLDELDGFLEHLAREVHDPGYAALLERLLGDGALREAVAAGAVHDRRPPRLPRRAARAHRRGRHARAGDVPAARAAELGPADLRRARARPRQDARVHVRRGDRAVGGGPPARPRRARPAGPRAVHERPRRRAPARAAALRARPTTGRTAASARPRRWRSTASTRSTRASRARSSTAC